MMDEAQYDTPWELKARGLAAALARTRPHSATNAADLHAGAASIPGLIRVSPPQPRIALHSQLNRRIAVPPHNSTQMTTSIPNGNSATAAAAPERSRSAFIPQLQHSHSRNNSNYPLVQIGPHGPQPISSPSNSPPILPPPFPLNSSADAFGFNASPPPRRPSSHRFHFDETTMVHEQIDRVEAEKRLAPRRTGDYLLRRRPDGNLAMSLRAADTVLHIKLERREGAWVLGEGPAFKTIGSVLRHYRRVELPIRGAEHVLLREPMMNELSGL